MENSKYNFIKEKFERKALSYYSFLVWLIDNSANLMDFTISKKEIEDQYLNIQFNYEKFVLEFSTIPELKCYAFLKNEYNDSIYHITLRGRKISPKYSDDIIKEVASKNYNTTNIQSLISEKDERNAHICVKIGIERFYNKYKNINPDEENIYISEDIFFNNFVYPLDDYLQKLGSHPDFKDDYNRYLYNYQSLDFYLETINEVLAINGLNLIKRNQQYTFKKVPKSHKEKVYKTTVSIETRNFGSFNLSSNSVRLDGSYGDHTYRDPISGRFYSTPSYDNYGHDSNPD